MCVCFDLGWEGRGGGGSGELIHIKLAGVSNKIKQTRNSSVSAAVLSTLFFVLRHPVPTSYLKCLQ